MNAQTQTLHMDKAVTRRELADDLHSNLCALRRTLMKLKDSGVTDLGPLAGLGPMLDHDNITGSLSSVRHQIEGN